MAVLTDWNGAKLHWEYPGTDATEMHIKWGTSPGDYSGGTEIVTGNSGDIYFSDFLPDRGTYYIRAWPANGSGEGVNGSNVLELEVNYVIWLRIGK